MDHRLIPKVSVTKQILLGGCLLGLCLVSGCAKREKPADAARKTQTLLVGNVAEPADLDPAVMVAWTDANIAYSLFEGLTWIDERTTQPIPAAAERWEMSPDGLAYTFYLRPNGRWSDGAPVTAEDFVYSYKRMLTPSLAAPYSYMLWPIKNAKAYNSGELKDFEQVGLKAVSPLVLRISLEKPTPYLPALAAHQTWIPVRKAVVERFGRMDQKGTLWTRPGNLVGNGPFNLAEWQPNSHITVVKSATYWNAAHVRLNKIVFFPIESSESEELNFRGGQLHVTYGLPVTKLEPYRKSHPDELQMDHNLASYYLFFNTKRPPLDNPKVRLALSMAIDREALAKDVFRDSRSPAYGYVPPDCGGYTSRSKVSTNLDEARRLLAEAGYPMGKGLPSMEVQAYSSEDNIRSLEVIQARWKKELGVAITISPLEQKTLFQNAQNGDYMIDTSAWIADYPDPYSFLETMTTGNGNNWAKWSNPQYDALIDEASRCIDPARRFELFQQAEAIIVREAPLAPEFFGERPFLLKPYVKNWNPAQLQFRRFSDVWLE